MNAQNPNSLGSYVVLMLPAHKVENLVYGDILARIELGDHFILCASLARTK